MEHLQIYYAEGFNSFMDSVLAVSLSTGLPAADSIHFVSAMSIPDVDEITTLFLDRHNDHLQIYARKSNGSLIPTDDGYTIRDLKLSGYESTTEKRTDGEPRPSGCSALVWN